MAHVAPQINVGDVVRFKADFATFPAFQGDDIEPGDYQRHQDDWNANLWLGLGYDSRDTYVMALSSGLTYRVLVRFHQAQWIMDNTIFTVIARLDQAVG